LIHGREVIQTGQGASETVILSLIAEKNSGRGSDVRVDTTLFQGIVRVVAVADHAVTVVFVVLPSNGGKGQSTATVLRVGQRTKHHGEERIGMTLE